MSTGTKRLIIIDGYSLLFRAFYSTRFMSTTDGRPTNALYGFVSMLFSLMEKYQPDCLLVALDAHAKTFRHEEFAEYKGTRKETPQELISQLIVSRELIQALGIPTIELEGYEADDVVGTVSKQAEERGYHTIIISGDSDSLQLVDHVVTVVTPKQGVSEVNTYDPDAVVAKYGFGPEFVADYKALVGDTSDNIPGVPGIGDKSATLLIQKFGSVESIMERIEEVEEKFKKKLVAGLGQIPQSKRLATIVRDAPISFDFQPYLIDGTHLELAVKCLESFEFKTHSKKARAVLGAYLPGTEQSRVSATVVVESLQPEKLGEKSGKNLFDWISDREFAVVFTDSVPQQNMFEPAIPGDAYVAIGPEVVKANAAEMLEIIQRDPGRVTLHDAKPLYHTMEASVAPKMDTMIAGYILQSDRSTYPLRDLIQNYLDVNAPESPESLALGLSYLGTAMSAKMIQENQEKILNQIELPLVPILAEMEKTGIQVNKGFLNDFSGMLQGKIAAIQAEIFELAGQEFLIASPKQLGEVLFEKMELKGGKKTKTGWATGVEILSEIDHPICKAVLSWREHSKLKSTYSDSLPRMVLDDGRIHTSFNQTVAATGRLSSNEPNLQNIPIRTEMGRQIRKAFTAREGTELVSFDYSQIELRLLAHLCQDEPLVEAFRTGVDVHTVTAALTFHVEQSEVTKEQRRLAKMLNYAVLYGVSDFGLAQQLGEGFGVSESKELITQYFARFPKVKAFTESVVEQAKAKGYTLTLRGRRRYFPEIHSGIRMERLYAERQAMNAPIQGAAADLIKLAMVDVNKLLVGKKTKMLLQVHDELVFEMPPDEKDLLEPIRAIMSNAMPIDVPVDVDGKIGANWSEMTPITLNV
jgi:DNA polymerase-1